MIIYEKNIMFNNLIFIYRLPEPLLFYFSLSLSCPPSLPHDRLATEYKMKATLRRVSDPLRCQHLWDAITTIRNHKQLPSFDRIRRYMSRMHNMESGKLFCCSRVRVDYLWCNVEFVGEERHCKWLGNSCRSLGNAFTFTDGMETLNGELYQHLTSWL